MIRPQFNARNRLFEVRSTPDKITNANRLSLNNVYNNDMISFLYFHKTN